MAGLPAADQGLRIPSRVKRSPDLCGHEPADDPASDSPARPGDAAHEGVVGSGNLGEQRSVALRDACKDQAEDTLRSESGGEHANEPDYPTNHSRHHLASAVYQHDCTCFLLFPAVARVARGPSGGRGARLAERGALA
jgi:hypothetical protein